ncbi:MAG: Gfo/Idh/MocA family oxidoreductase [Treponema sp.]|uniref:Gfo/Idh/MocA family protein n=1 Tax=Treponema sp. TaxID=166 RepID=UPI0025D06E6B|nr:Gfo/Idh/MocA family oxidoreductase [Treponema sp.]MBR0496660.1 Gfo/Idh/MocA family oxidoreductase [Treponema sp.]
MEKKHYYAAIVGTGRIGFSLGFDKKREQPASHTMALLKNKRIKLIAAADSNEENLENWRKYVRKHNGKKDFTLVFPTSKELYENVTCLDIITVAVNEDNHLEECLKAIEYKPRLVILEKPVALNSEEAEKIRAKAIECGVPVMVNHERRFAKDYLSVVSLIDKIGDIQSVTGELDSGLRIYGEEFEKDGTYSLLHDGTHLVDILQFLLGKGSNNERSEVTPILKTANNSETDTTSPDTPADLSRNDTPLLTNPLVSGIYKDEEGIVRNFSAHYQSVVSKFGTIPEVTVKMSGRSKFFEFRIEILGTLGKICIGNGFAELHLREESKLYTGFYSLTKQKLKLPKKTGYFSGMIQNAVDFLDGNSELVSPLEDAISDLKVLEEIKAKF